MCKSWDVATFTFCKLLFGWITTNCEQPYLLLFLTRDFEMLTPTVPTTIILFVLEQYSEILFGSPYMLISISMR